MARRRKQLERVAAESLAVEAQEAREAGALAFYARIAAQCALPHSEPAGPFYMRENGRVTLSIVAPPQVGVPYGKVPRLLLAWVTTEAVRTRSPRLDLGESLSGFMAQLGMAATGGRHGTVGRFRNQAQRLFSSAISATFNNPAGEWAQAGFQVASRTQLWWSPRTPEQVALFGSYVVLSEEFYRLATTSPVPLDLRVLRALQSSLGIDLYVWSTWRMSYLRQPVEIPWAALAAQFGSNFAQVRQFKAALLRQARQVIVLYPSLRIEEGERGLILRPSPPHIRAAQAGGRSLRR